MAPSPPSTPLPETRPGAAPLAWAFSIAAVVFGAVFSYRMYLLASDPARAARFSIGGIMVLASGAALVRFALRRYGHTLGAGPSPIVLGAIALVVLGIQMGIRDAHGDSLRTTVERCRAGDPYPFGPAPAGTQLIAGTAETRDAALRSVELTSLPRQVPADELVAYEIVGPDGIRGYAFAYPGAEALTDGLEAFAAGIGNATGAAGVNGCWAVAVIAPAGADVTELATVLGPG